MALTHDIPGPVRAFCRQTQVRGHRAVLVLSGTREWANRLARSALEGNPPGDVLWISDIPAPPWPGLDPARTHTLLGRELDTLVLDTFAGFDPDAFGALSGTVRGGGMLVLICPPLAQWEHFPDPQNRRITVAPYPAGTLSGRLRARLARVLATSPGLALLEQHRPPRHTPPTHPPGAPATAPTDPECLTVDQQLAVEAVEHLVGGHRRRPVVLISDRGRGKSSALGIAAARLLRRGLRNIVVTGPRLEAVHPVLAHAARLLPQARTAGTHVGYGDARLAFVAPDALLAGHAKADLVLVDEAAALPAATLESLLRRHSRIAFATTVHGYEGSGRGFAVRFRRTLDRLTPDWRELRLERPIRWTPEDPLEALTFRALLLDAEPAPLEALAGADAETCELRELDRDRLAADEATLGELFGLLVQAHYRTSPLDLWHLLDGPNISVLVLAHRGHVAATALLADEGGLDRDTAHQVWLGRRRLQGHLLPQSLAQHLGLERAPTLRLRRVMRIAVHPALRGRGLGSRLLAKAIEDPAGRRIDALGASFGADAPLMHFWRRNGLLPVRLGLRRDAASGAHSAQVLRPVSTAGETLTATARQRFAVQLPHLLADALRDLEPELAAELLLDLGSGGEAPPDAADLRDLEAIAHGRRQPETAPAALWRLACTALAKPHSTLDRPARHLLVARVLQHRGWPACARLLGLSGRAAAVAALRQAVACELAHIEAEGEEDLRNS